MIRLLSRNISGWISPDFASALGEPCRAGRAGRPAFGGIALRRSRRGIFLLGLAGLLSLLGLIIFAINSSTMSSYQQAGRLRRRMAATQLALGGIATAQARLGANPEWKGETWTPAGPAGGLGRVVIKKIESAEKSNWTIEVEVSTPANGRAAETARLRAYLRPSPGGAPAALKRFLWLPYSAGEGRSS